MPCESRTRLSSLEGWRLCRSAKSTAKRKERESNPQGLLLACFRDRCHRQLACPSVEAAAAGIEPAKGRLTGACLYQHRPHRNRNQGGRIRTCALKLSELARCQASRHPGKVGAGGFEPPISCSRSTRVSRLPHALISTSKHPAGVEPALPPWQGSRLPLHHGRVESLVELSKIRAPDHGYATVPGLEPTSPPTNLRSVPGVRGPRRRPPLRGGARTSAFHSVGSEGLEPSNRARLTRRQSCAGR